MSSAAPDVPVPARVAQTTLRQNLRCIIYCALVSIGAMQYGIDLSVINAAQAMKGFLRVFGFPSPHATTGYGISTSFQQTITSMMNVGVILGSGLLHPVAGYLGRRYSFLVASFTCFVGNTILILATSKGAIVFGRLVFGVSNGLFIALTAIWVSEAAPPRLRGGLMSLHQLAVCIGSVVGTVVNNATKTIDSRLAYQIPLITLYAVPLFCCVLAFTIPESPRWLVLKQRNDDARRHLFSLRGESMPAELVEAELVLIMEAVSKEREAETSTLGSLKLIFSKRERTRTLLAFAANTYHGASGFPFLSGYSTYFFQIAGSKDAFIDSIIVTTISIIGALAGVALNRYFGRRPMSMFAFTSQGIFMLVIGIVWSVAPGTETAGKVIVAMCVLFQCSFSAAGGPLGILCASEIPNTRLRAITFGMGSAIGFLANFTVTLTTPYFINPAALNIGPKIGYIWFASNLVTLVFVYFFIPETHHRSLEDIDEMFYSKVPLRQFKGYRCTGYMHNDEMLDKKDVTYLEDVTEHGT